MGPTASGKTGLSLDLAQQLDCEIISVDSALVYTQMNIGTAKPNAEELAQAKHHLIDIIDPADSYSVADFCRDTQRLIADIHSRGKTPLLVGGTMMYFNALLNGISQVPETDESVRVDVHRDAAEKGWPAMHQELITVDPVVAERVHPNDPQRIGRALEVYRATGKPLSDWQQKKTPGLQELTKAPIYQYAIAPDDRKVLHQRIEQRFDLMLEQGFIEEVEALRQRGDLHVDMPSMRCVGYRQVWHYLDGVDSFAEMREKGIAATRQLAKRQFTWLRGWSDVTWLDTFCDKNSAKIVELVTI